MDISLRSIEQRRAEAAIQCSSPRLADLYLGTSISFITWPEVYGQTSKVSVVPARHRQVTVKDDISKVMGC